MVNELSSYIAYDLKGGYYEKNNINFIYAGWEGAAIGSVLGDKSTGTSIGSSIEDAGRDYYEHIKEKYDKQTKEEREREYHDAYERAERDSGRLHK